MVPICSRRAWVRRLRGCAGEAGRGACVALAELGFAIVRTGKKVQTHEHLRGLVGKDLESLVPLAKTCVETFTPGAATSFVRAVSAYAEALVALDLQAPETVARCAELAAEPWCRAVKGCGALGADTISVLFFGK